MYVEASRASVRQTRVVGWTVDPTEPHVLLHYSEQRDIAEFVPHVPRSNPTATAAVWAIDPARSPLYWFPRDCPRVAVWANTDEQRDQLAGAFDTTAQRVQAAPLAWLGRIRSCNLHEYRFDPASFEPWPDAEGQWIARRAQTPRSVEAVGDILDRHASADVELRLVPDLAPLRARAIESGLPFSIVRFKP